MMSKTSEMILNDLLSKCPRSRAAEARHEGNRLFGESKFEQACEAGLRISSFTSIIYISCLKMSYDIYIISIYMHR